MNPFEYLNLVVGERIKDNFRRYGWLMLAGVVLLLWVR